MAMTLTFSNIHFAYPNQSALFNGLSVSLEAGQVTTLMGRSGCGKSTLLNIMNGIFKPISGRIDTGGKICATIFQNQRLIPWLTIGQNIAFGAKSLKIKVSAEEISSTLLNVGLPESIQNAYPKILSGGMAQRVSLARAFICKPEILFMDEPFSALDHALKNDLMSRIVKFINQTKGYAFFVTHDLHEACQISNEVYEMSGFPATLKPVETIPIPPQKRDDAVIEKIIIQIKEKFRKSRVPNFTKYCFASSDENVQSYADEMKRRHWRAEFIQDDASFSQNERPFEKRPDLIIIDGQHTDIETLLAYCQNQVTRFIFIKNTPALKNVTTISGTKESLQQWWGWEEIYKDLVADVPNTKIEAITIGHNWTYTQTQKSSGLARTPSRDTQGGRTVKDAGTLHQKTLRQLAEYLFSDDDLERSIGISAVNAYYNSIAKGHTEEHYWGFRPFRECVGSKVTIGHFPPATKILPDVKVIEREPKEGHYTTEEGEDLIPNADHLIITAQTLMNGSLPRILFLAQGANIMLLGPTTPLAPIWKKYGVRFACGIIPTHQQNMLNFISQAGTMLILDEQAQKMTIEY